MNCVKECPMCSGDTEVIDTRVGTKTKVLTRRRACKKCGYIFRTVEIEEEEYFKLIGRRK